MKNVGANCVLGLIRSIDVIGMREDSDSVASTHFDLVILQACSECRLGPNPNVGHPASTLMRCWRRATDLLDAALTCPDGRQQPFSDTANTVGARECSSRSFVKVNARKRPNTLPQR
jgi:hypothetical protein